MKNLQENKTALITKFKKLLQNIETATEPRFAQSVKPAYGRAFTLAEVLITLGVIGIVAALTMPALINKFRIKQLEVAFKRSSSAVEQALTSTANDMDLKSIKDLNTICGDMEYVDKSSDKYQNVFGPCLFSKRDSGEFEEISRNFISKFKVVESVERTNLKKDNKYIRYTDYSGNYEGNYKDLYGINDYKTPYAKLHLLNDGTAVTEIAFFYHEWSDGLSFTFDTNGPYKGPNRYGYDIFMYHTGTWGHKCTKGSFTRELYTNGRGCYEYALKDINPDDNTKGYWESLKL